jgi:hypothetical protein
MLTNYELVNFSLASSETFGEIYDFTTSPVCLDVVVILQSKITERSEVISKKLL